MNKKIILCIVIISCILIGTIGLYSYTHQSKSLNDYFDFSGPVITSWNSNNEFSFQKDIPTKFNESYENVTVKIDFYKNSKYLKSSYVTNNTENTKLTIHTTVKLDEKPNNFKFEIINADLTETTEEAIKFGSNNGMYYLS